MKYTFHIIDVFSSTPLGGAQVAVLPDAAGISTEGMQGVSMGRRSETEAEARKRDGVVTSVGVGGATGMGRS
jgi:predicted PhzF superfamily epimerase YddE/YHI9